MYDVDYCNEVADRISQYTWDHRHEFKFTGNFDEVDKSVETALNYPEKNSCDY